MTSKLIINSVKNTSGATALNVSTVASPLSRYIRQVINIVDTTDRSATTSWTAGGTWGPYTGFRAKSLLKIYYSYPARNDSTSWGGLYFEPQISINSANWITTGSRGHDTVMDYGQASIHHTNNCMLFDPQMTESFSVSLRFYFRSYDGTIGLNNSGDHNMNQISGTATLMSGNNGLQHYGHWIIEELALFSV